jgi:hypothetical protein
MRYLVHPKDSHPFFTAYYDFDSHYVEGMIIYDLTKFEFTINGWDWNKITVDHL